MNEKVCTKCGNQYPATTEFFRARERGRYGVSARCLTCERAEYKERHRREREAAGGKARPSIEEIDDFWNEKSEAEIAYLAGLFDGEGCVYIGRSYARAIKDRGPDARQYLFLSISIASTTLPVMLWLKENFGGSFRSKRPKKGIWKECYGWRLMSQQAAGMLRRILPYLIIKREQAEIAIEFQDRISFAYSREVSEEEMAERIALKEQIEALR